jgi:hypothetical protein
VNAPAAIVLSALVALLPMAAPAEERPSEADLFGAPAQPTEATPAPPTVQATEVGRDDAILGSAPEGRPAGVLTAAQENPLALGGLLYLRASTTWYRAMAPADWPLGAPSLVDLYVDARPNDRVRAFALARTSWSPVGTPPFIDGIPGAPPSLTTALDQLWVNFDVHRKVFVTAGRQHVKWGVGRFWNPTDYLHPVRRNPLDPFDARTGSTLVKLHVPWEARGWNVYGIALLDDPAGKGDGANTVGKVALAARAEVVLGSAELGADALVRDGQRPRFGLDFSTGIWDLDVHGEVALRTSSDVQLWEMNGPSNELASYRPRSLDGVTPQAVLGVSYAISYSDEDAVRVAAEYFYNGLGYDDAHIYPWLLAQPALFAGEPATAQPAIAAALGGKGSDFSPYYLGRHYAGLSVLLASPGSWNDHTFTLSAIANLSDGSAIVRLDHAVIVNTWLTVESYLAGNLGKEGGEFRFALHVPSITVPDPTAIPPGTVKTAPIDSPPPVLSAGVALRVKL